MLSRIGRIFAKVILAGSLGLGLAPAAWAADVTMFAAASLKNALEEIRAEFEAQTGYSVALSLAGSSLLARQIELGAPADIYLPASPDWMDYLDGAGHLVAGSRLDLLGNRLVLVGPRQSARGISGFKDPALLEQLGRGKLAMALVTAVPAGIYGKSALQSLGLWQDLHPHIAQSDNVRAALALVAIGEAPLGIVYASDAEAEPRVVTLAEFPASAHAPIRYPLALIRPADRPAVLAFYSYLQGPDAQAAFLAAGFDLIVE
ncbi:molybdate ABC transporter substrate-binding protein [Pseudophaeobacter sp.]|uniref:molybdate ABC transporter substrate-binding protein n=1 Tax=Pseudophaeobacter sp. TaxID=1971739 RepID=UPI00405A1148